MQEQLKIKNRNSSAITTDPDGDRLGMLTVGVAVYVTKRILSNDSV
jgi:phosphomannomutase